MKTAKSRAKKAPTATPAARRTVALSKNTLRDLSATAKAKGVKGGGTSTMYGGTR